MDLRPYQSDLSQRIDAAWASGFKAPMMVLPTGGGKTVILAHKVREEPGASVVMAHRAELVGQLSLALARERVRHRVVGPPDLAKLCVQAHMEELKSNYVDPSAKAGVASVQSVKGYKDHSNWFNQVRLLIGDEGHHFLRENQFGKAVLRFPNPRMLFVTATAIRTDGKGLGAHAHGFADTLIQGPSPRDLIVAGYLSKYRVFQPPNNFNRAAIKVTASGELSPVQVHDETKKSTVLGDVVEHYCKHAMGKLGLTFADSIDNATDIARRFRAAGVNAEVLTGDTEGWLRAQVLRRFKNREVLQIVSVALIDEGFDCPAVEVVSDAAATESFGRFAQRFGRGLRILTGKDYILYFDHVGNTTRHGLPDRPREYTLDSRDRRGSGNNSGDDAIPTRVCTKCGGTYESYMSKCPYCQTVHVPSSRSGPEQVDGDLVEMTGTPWMSELVKEVARIDGPPLFPASTSAVADAHIRNVHRERQHAQAKLRKTIALWGGWKKTIGHDDSESYKLFYYRYGLDVGTAKTLNKRDADELCARIEIELAKHGVHEATI